MTKKNEISQHFPLEGNSWCLLVIVDVHVYITGLEKCSYLTTVGSDDFFFSS
jgi:hypothetical protein